MADAQEPTGWQETNRSAGRVVVISGPGGVGKGTVVAALRRRRNDLAVSVSATTRPIRPREEDGVHYHFVSADRFQQMIDDDSFVEWADFNNHRYGTPWTSLATQSSEDGMIVLEIDVQGAAQIKARVAEHGDIAATLVFLAPPSWDALKDRLVGRGSEDESGIAARLAIGRREMAAADWFDHVVVNDTLDAAVSAVDRILDDVSAG